MKKYIVVLTAVCTLLFCACSKMLDIPQKGVVAYETYYTSDEAAEAALVNVYANMVQNVYGSIGNWNPYFFMVNYSADDVFAAGKNKDDHPDVRLFNEYRYDATYKIQQGGGPLHCRGEGRPCLVSHDCGAQLAAPAAGGPLPDR